jgi:flagellar protein FlbT
MTGLVLKLKPFEKLLVNGAVLQNGPRATRLRVRSADAYVLRLRDALHPRDAASHAGRIYYIAQLAVAGEVEAGEALIEIAPLIEQSIAVANERQSAAFAKARDAASAGKLFSVMRAIKPLLGDAAMPPPEAA